MQTLGPFVLTQGWGTCLTHANQAHYDYVPTRKLQTSKPRIDSGVDVDPMPRL